MKQNFLNDEAKNLRIAEKTYKEIGSLLNISLFSARNLCAYVPTQNAKRGPKPKITKKINLRIKRAISTFQDAGQKVNSRKIVETTEAKVSIRTVQQHLMGMQLKYNKGVTSNQSDQGT